MQVSGWRKLFVCEYAYCTLLDKAAVAAEFT
jgi:hypothetical protein